MNNGKTIKQIADELGVSKTAVYKKIDNHFAVVFYASKKTRYEK